MSKPEPSRLFIPLLAGASLRDRMIGSIGALMGIGLAGLICAAMFPASMPWIIAPIGASAVLLFAVPSSPLAQPWSIVGGNAISAIVGIVVVDDVSWEAHYERRGESTHI
ncbi:MAG: HPP family protein, partial [Ferrovibrionaceae bacterium]